VLEQLQADAEKRAFEWAEWKLELKTRPLEWGDSYASLETKEALPTINYLIPTAYNSQTGEIKT
jgi:hypothetical protein